MKSALELAMEKANEVVGTDEEYVKLSPEQVKAIDEVKRQYEAKWAEQEIVLKGKIQQLASERSPRHQACGKGGHANSSRKRPGSGQEAARRRPIID